MEMCILFFCAIMKIENWPPFEFLSFVRSTTHTKEENVLLSAMEQNSSFRCLSFRGDELKR